MTALYLKAAITWYFSPLQTETTQKMLLYHYVYMW